MKKIRISFALGLLFSILFGDTQMTPITIENQSMFFPQSVIEFEQEQNDYPDYSNKITIIDSDDKEIQFDFFIAEIFHDLFGEN